MKKATDCGLAAIVLLMLFSLVLTAKDVFLATVPKDKNAALFLCLGNRFGNRDRLFAENHFCQI